MAPLLHWLQPGCKFQNKVRLTKMTEAFTIIRLACDDKILVDLQNVIDDEEVFQEQKLCAQNLQDLLLHFIPVVSDRSASASCKHTNFDTH